MPSQSPTPPHPGRRVRRNKPRTLTPALASQRVRKCVLLTHKSMYCSSEMCNFKALFCSAEKEKEMLNFKDTFPMLGRIKKAADALSERELVGHLVERLVQQLSSSQQRLLYQRLRRRRRSVETRFILFEFLFFILILNFNLFLFSQDSRGNPTPQYFESRIPSPTSARRW